MVKTKRLNPVTILYPETVAGVVDAAVAPNDVKWLVEQVIDPVPVVVLTPSLAQADPVQYEHY
jgi:hypothetical protein